MKPKILWLAFAITGWVGLDNARSQVREAWVARNTNGSLMAMKVDGAGNVHVTGPAGTVKYDSDGNPIWISPTGGIAIALDKTGNAYVASTAFQTNGTGDFLTAKLNRDGQLLWTKRYDGPTNADDQVRAMALDDTGNLYITGFSAPDGFHSRDFATIKYDAEGRELWVDRYDGRWGGWVDVPAGIATDGHGNVYVTGFADSSSRFGHAATIKYDADGRRLWVADHATYPSGVAVDNSGNVFVTGRRDSWGCYDYATVKCDTNGNTLWTAAYDDSYGIEDVPRALAVDNRENVVVTGTIYGFKFFESFFTNGPAVLDCLTVKYAGDGKQLWTARTTNAVCVSLKTDHLGNSFVLSQSGGDCLTTKYDTSGNQLWQTRYSNSCAVALEIVDGDAIYVAANTDMGFAVVKYVESPTPGFPNITSQPIARTVTPGVSVAFGVAATGLEPLTFQWCFNGEAMRGATNATLVLTNVEPEREGDYSVQVSNAVGVTLSPEARLTILSRFISVSIIPEGGLRFDLLGRVRCDYELQYSEDLVTWISLEHRFNETGTIQFADFAFPSSRQRFYRAIQHGCGYCPRGT